MVIVDLSTLHPTIAAWVAADEAQDLAGMHAQLSPDAVLVSPLTDGFTFNGADEVIKVYAAAFDLLADIRITAVTGTGKDWVLHGTNTLKSHHLEELQWHHVGPDGLIDRITLFIRPVPAALDLLARIGPGLQRRGLFGPGGGIASRLALPLAAALRLTETVLMPRLRMSRVRLCGRAVM